MTMTATKPARSLRYKDGILVISEGREVETYRVIPIRGEDGLDVLGHRLLKKNGESYDVDGAADSCECMGHLHWGRCKHLAAVAKLIELGLIAR